MSSWGNFYSKSFQLDSDIVTKLEVLLTDHGESDSLLDQIDCKLLNQSLNIPEFSVQDIENLSKEVILQCYYTVLEANKHLTKLFEKVNQERKALRTHNFTLLKKLFELENATKTGFDKNFLQFCNKSVFLSLELQKTFLEKERQISARLQQSVDQRDKEIQEIRRENAALEKVIGKSYADDKLLKELQMIRSQELSLSQHDSLLDPGYSGRRSHGRLMSAHISQTTSTSTASSEEIAVKMKEGSRKSQTSLIGSNFDAVIKDKVLRRINELQLGNHKSSADLSTTYPINEESSSPETSPGKEARRPSMFLTEKIKMRVNTLNLQNQEDDNLLSAELPAQKAIEDSPKLRINFSKTPKASKKSGVDSSFSTDTGRGNKTPTRVNRVPKTPSATQSKILSDTAKSNRNSTSSTLSTKSSRTTTAHLKNSNANNGSAPYFMSVKAISRAKPTTPKGVSHNSISVFRPSTNLSESQSIVDRSFQKKKTRVASDLNKTAIIRDMSFENPSKNALDRSEILMHEPDKMSKTPKHSLKRNATMTNFNTHMDNSQISAKSISKDLPSKSQAKSKLFSFLSSTLHPQIVNRNGLQKQKSQKLILSQSISEPIKSGLLQDKLEFTDDRDYDDFKNKGAFSAKDI